MRLTYRKDNPYNIIPVLNNSTGLNPYPTTAMPWQSVLTDKQRVKPKVPRFAELAERFKLVMLRLPLCTAAPMPVDGRSLAAAIAAANPGDPDIQAKADADALMDGCRILHAAGVELLFYLGSPLTLERKGLESIPAWYSRLRWELEPYLKYGKGILFDAMMGTHPSWSEWSNEALLFALRELSYSGYFIGKEPTSWWHNKEELGQFASFIDEDTHTSWAAKNPDAVLTWTARKPNAIAGFAGDPSPMQLPGALGESVLLWLDFKAADEKANPMGYVKRVHEMYPHAWLSMPFSYVPQELI